MRGVLSLLLVLLMAGLMTACGDVEDKDGNPLQVGKHYVMTKEGLMSAPPAQDLHGRKLTVGAEYIMTERGLKPITGRGIKGVVQDLAGKPLRGVWASIAGSEFKALTDSDGSFSLPFVEGYVKLAFDIEGLPKWCAPKEVEHMSLRRDRYPMGWDVGTVSLSCNLAGYQNGVAKWADPSGEFVDNGDGTVSDMRTGLMWEASAQAQNVPWHKAKEHCDELQLGGYDDWRLPTPEELATLYKANIACGWTGLEMISVGPSLWTAEQMGLTSAWVINLCSGQGRKSQGLDEGPSGVNPSVIAVRSFK